jgi:hypothetical protein
VIPKEFFSVLFRARAASANRISGSAYSFFMDGIINGKRVNERISMQMTTVYSCVCILSEAVAGLPLHLYQLHKKWRQGKSSGISAVLSAP